MKAYDKQGVDLEVYGIAPDWTMIGTSEYAEKELAGFKFRGSGWYIDKGDTILVLPYSYGKGADLTASSSTTAGTPEKHSTGLSMFQ